MSSMHHSGPLIAKRSNMGSITRGHLPTLSKMPRSMRLRPLLITVISDINDNFSILSSGKATQMQTTHGSQQITYTPQH